MLNDEDDGHFEKKQDFFSTKMWTKIIQTIKMVTSFLLNWFSDDDDDEKNNK